MRATAYDMALPMLAIAAALAVFVALVRLDGVNPLQLWALLFKGAFGDAFSWQNTLQRAAPLMLTALCVALPARAGLVIIGADGALLLPRLPSSPPPPPPPLPPHP